MDTARKTVTGLSRGGLECTVIINTDPLHGSKHMQTTMAVIGTAHTLHAGLSARSTPNMLAGLRAGTALGLSWTRGTSCQLAMLEASSR